MNTRNNAPLTFSNNAQKQYYGRRGPFRVFGEDVDQREAFSDQKAAERFETVWNNRLGRAVGEADVILAEAAADKLPGTFRAFSIIKPSIESFDLTAARSLPN